MRPANTDTFDGAPPVERRDDVADLRERHDRGDVHLDARVRQPLDEVEAGSRLVLVTGIFT